MAAKDETDAIASTPLVPKKSGNPLMPIIAVVVLVPALCYAVMDFVIIPKIKSSLGAPAVAESHGSEKKKSGGHGAEKKSGGHGGGHGAVMPQVRASLHSALLSLTWPEVTIHAFLKQPLTSRARILKLSISSKKIDPPYSTQRIPSYHHRPLMPKI